MADVRIAADLTALWQEAATAVVNAVQETAGEQPRFSLALSGGSTPRGLYRRLAVSPYRERISWQRLEIFWGDERTVSPDHPDSNARMAREALLDQVPLAPQQIHRLQGEEVPEREDARYEQEIRTVLGGDPPAFDLILLGMGAEGHTASLFPGSAALESSRLVEAVQVEALGTTRLTFTPRLINAARRIFFLVAGREKAAALREVLEGTRQPDLYPAQAISPVSGRVTWFLDREAASLLAGKQGGERESPAP